jgi:hypothetical protein
MQLPGWSCVGGEASHVDVGRQVDVYANVKQLCGLSVWHKLASPLSMSLWE